MLSLNSEISSIMRQSNDNFKISWSIGCPYHPGTNTQSLFPPTFDALYSRPVMSCHVLQSCKVHVLILLEYVKVIRSNLYAKRTSKHVAGSVKSFFLPPTSSHVPLSIVYDIAGTWRQQL